MTDERSKNRSQIESDLVDKANDRDASWRELCERASKEMDPEKLLDLVLQISHALDERERKRSPRKPPVPPIYRAQQSGTDQDVFHGEYFIAIVSQADSALKERSREFFKALAEGSQPSHPRIAAA